METQEEFDATKEWYMGSEFYSTEMQTRLSTKILYRQWYRVMLNLYII